MMQKSFLQRWTYCLTQLAVRGIAIILFSLRIFGAENWPREGGALVCSNHQSYFDPVIIGSSCSRRMNYLARESLFRFFLFGWLIRWYDAIPIQREGMGIGGLKETMRRLKRGEMVLIFPEGTRTSDGQLQELKPGFCTVARRSRAAIVPLALDGAYQAWPKEAAWPRLSAVHISVGLPITAEEIGQLSDEELEAELAQRISACFATVRASRDVG